MSELESKMDLEEGELEDGEIEEDEEEERPLLPPEVEEEEEQKSLTPNRYERHRHESEESDDSVRRRERKEERKRKKEEKKKKKREKEERKERNAKVQINRSNMITYIRVDFNVALINKLFLATQAKAISNFYLPILSLLLLFPLLFHIPLPFPVIFFPFTSACIS